ncbi:hypothetical protein [Pelagicoccus sp. SDUM812005]|uniref:hypothetical protein n=1 Tax=Pelagicoccus sp. SDUM812005 TaxID=3041257 RepID=UPI00281031B3|nr:hypothetical protein [Pelagicoccus sp. SDUM812005]MDQ8181707.1 hypothetical protein [Pelagicoccus sp. SDUM812005]
MTTDEIFKAHFGDKDLTLRGDRTIWLRADGAHVPVFTAPDVRIIEDLGKEDTQSPGNIVRFSYRLSEIADPFWLTLFAFFQQSGFSVFISEDHTLQVTTFEGLHASTFGIAKNCIRLSNSTYRHYATRARALAYAQDVGRGLCEFEPQGSQDAKAEGSGEKRA